MQLARTPRRPYWVATCLVNAVMPAFDTLYAVRANCIVPGLILTDPVRAQIPPKLLEAYASGLLTTFVGEPDDIADLVMFLVSPASRYITGQSIAIDGGLSVHSARLTDS